MNIADELESWAMGVELSGCRDYDHVVRRAVEALRAADVDGARLRAVWANLDLVACRKCKHLHHREYVCYMCGYDYSADERPSAAERSGDG